MNQITTRAVEAADLPTIKEIIKTWYWAQIFEDETSRNVVAGQFLNLVLHDSSVGRVAVMDGKVVGVIFGSVTGESPQLRMLQNNPIEAFSLLNVAEEESKNFSNYLSNYTTSIDQLLSGKEELYDGSAIFFSVSDEVQGMGIGKRL
jgi:predicted N-acetyltransferase YhbS